MRLKACAALAVALVVAGAAPALAAESEVSFKSVFDYIFNVLGVVLPPVVVMLARHYIKQWLGVKLDEKSAAVLEAALNKGVAAGLGAARLAAKKIETLKTRNEIVAGVAEYVASTVPDAVERFGLTPEKLKTKAIAHLEDRLNPAPA